MDVVSGLMGLNTSAFIYSCAWQYSRISEDRPSALNQQVHAAQPGAGTKQNITRFMNIEIEYQKRLLNVEGRYLK